MILNKTQLEGLLALHKKRESLETQLKELLNVVSEIGSMSVMTHDPAYPVGRFISVDLLEMAPAHRSLIIEVWRRHLRTKIDAITHEIQTVEIHTT